MRRGEECPRRTSARASPTTRATHADDAGHARSDQHRHATLCHPPRRAQVRSVMTKDGAFPRVRRPRRLDASPTRRSARRRRGQRLHPGWPPRCTPLGTATPRAVLVTSTAPQCHRTVSTRGGADPGHTSSVHCPCSPAERRRACGSARWSTGARHRFRAGHRCRVKHQPTTGTKPLWTFTRNSA